MAESSHPSRPVRFLADECLNRAIVRGLLHRLPGADIVVVQEVGLSGVDDEGVLAWAAREGQVVVTSDVNTMIGYAIQRMRRGEAMTGLIVVPARAALAPVIDDIEVIATSSEASDWVGLVQYLPWPR